MKAKSIILVHGAWADASCWHKNIVPLVNQGFAVTSVQMPLTGFHDDVAALKRALAVAQGPVVVVGHSYGGAVVTEGAGDDKVSALVYIAAFAPDAGQSAADISRAAPMPSSDLKPDASGLIDATEPYIRNDFAQDVSVDEQTVLFAVQRPTSTKCLAGVISRPAWRAKPNWYLVASDDHAIAPSQQRDMAKRMDAVTSEIVSSHCPMISHPSVVNQIILEAAGAGSAAAGR